MTIQQAIISAVKKLKKQSTASAHLDAEVLLSFVAKKPKSYLLGHLEKKLTSHQAKKFNKLIAKRQRGWPVAYLTNNKEFYGLDFFVNKNVLVPRPETEILVEETIKQARQLKKQEPYAINSPAGNLPKGDHMPLTIADIGTGSGCVAVTLARYLTFVKIFATDISARALLTAKKNARRHKVLNRITFRRGNLLNPLKKIKADLLVANLPYLTVDELPAVPHEPKLALDGGKMGLELIEKLLAQAPGRLNPDGVILLEISPTQIKAVEYFSAAHLPEKKVFFVKDLAGRYRVAVIR